MVAGVGFRKGTTAADILAVVRTACAAAGVNVIWIDALATADFKAAETGVREAAETLGVPLIACGRDALDRVSDRVLTRSETVQAAVGVPSVAEAAALVAAGRNARLSGPRITVRNATCALATGDGP